MGNFPHLPMGSARLLRSVWCGFVTLHLKGATGPRTYTLGTSPPSTAGRYGGEDFGLHTAVIHHSLAVAVCQWAQHAIAFQWRSFVASVSVRRVASVWVRIVVSVWVRIVVSVWVRIAVRIVVSGSG